MSLINHHRPMIYIYKIDEESIDTGTAPPGMFCPRLPSQDPPQEQEQGPHETRRLVLCPQLDEKTEHPIREGVLERDRDADDKGRLPQEYQAILPFHGPQLLFGRTVRRDEGQWVHREQARRGLSGQTGVSGHGHQ